jgi:predicted nucleotidyltransferase
MEQVSANIGIFGSEEGALTAVVRRLVTALDPESIWLFGSRASGTHRPDSDFDLLVVTRREDGDAGFDYDRVYAPVLGTGVGCDVVPCRIDDFEREAAVNGSFVSRILEQGIGLYDKREDRIAAGPRG